MKKTAMFFMCSLFLAVSALSTSAADLDGCIIKKIGVYPGIANESLNRSGYPVFLQHASFGTTNGVVNTKMFYLSTQAGKEGLATLLTALSLDQPVLVRIGTSASSPSDSGSIITVIYLSK